MQEKKIQPTDMQHKMTTMGAAKRRRVKHPTSPLNTFLHNLASDKETPCEKLTIVVDNAHLPIDHAIDEKSIDDIMHAFSRSLTSINTVQFPPAFLKESGRWDSMEGSSDSDFSLSVPCRSCDDRKRSATESRRHVHPASSLDSTERLLLELPMEKSPFTTPNWPLKERRKNSQECPLSPAYVDLPSLKECPYEEVETHPIVTLRKLSKKYDKESLQKLLELIDFDDDGDDDDDADDDTAGQESESSSDDESGHSADVSIPDEVYDIEKPAPESLIASFIMKQPSHEGSYAVRKSLRSMKSPKTLLEFPYTSASPSTILQGHVDLSTLLDTHDAETCSSQPDP